MNIEDGIAVEPGAVVSAAKPTLPGVGAGAVILIGTWIGLIAGFGDVGFLVVNKRCSTRDFYHLGRTFPWIVPLSVMVMVTCAGDLGRFARRIRGSVRLGLPVLLLSFVGFLGSVRTASARAVGLVDHIHRDGRSVGSTGTARGRSDSCSWCGGP